MNQKIKEQFIPLFLTVLTFAGLWVFLYGFILVLNLFPTSEHISLELRKRDILVGLTIYLKTSVDFAIFIGNLMKSNPGWKKRISIELGTAVGNAAGTLVVLTIWNFAREVVWLMAIMIFLAGLVLLRMAEESLEEFTQSETRITKIHVHKLNTYLKRLNQFFSPLLKRLVPHVGITNMKTLSFWNLFIFSFTIPFILGLDDFAGYIPLFSIINVYGFAIGVFLGHMVLNLALFLSPKKTVHVVQLPFILLVGGLAFIAIAAWGFYEVYHLLLSSLLG